MDIKQATYLKSSALISQCPEHHCPEYAFIGRSNVGKSSLINMLTGNRKLAKTSATPGKTLLINHFEINGGKWYLVDLPGYGFAKRSKTERTKLEQMISGYILQRETLTNLFVLIDCRHAPQQIDLEFMQWLGESGIPFSIVFTKADKLSRQALQKSIDAYLNRLAQDWDPLPPHFITSAETRQGRDELLAYIDSINKEISQS
ncbi:MAG: YihA family ribosome biogenesis GTP-binding protein [Bacteroidaceae bacterium]|nr:YihA family ribosome biogenesis GTP-binding protein [Bacteroidaceae bacterium]MBR1801410.1 YihA family ribosome biogenesis GTP-binding protein [Bacteroidaceae bacterium]